MNNIKELLYITVSTFTRQKSIEESNNILRALAEGYTIITVTGAGNGVVHYILERNIERFKK